MDDTDTINEDDELAAAMLLSSLYLHQYISGSNQPQNKFDSFHGAGDNYVVNSFDQSNRRILFQCTWPGCGHQCEECHQIEKHVRTKHLGRLGSSGESSDHEEEFYYTEIELDDNSSLTPQSPSASNDDSAMSDCQSPISSSPGNVFFSSSSAPTRSHLDMVRPPHEDPEYQKMLMQQETTARSNQKQSSLLSKPINIPGASSSHQYAKSAPVSMPSRSATNNNNNKYMRSNSKGGTTLLQPLSKSLSPTKRGRGESRKCRKVYGMDNRDLWCTQCKWKKACSRFTD